MAFDLAYEVENLNTSGGFNHALNYEKVAEAAVNAPTEKVQKLLKDLEGQRESIKDPTAWVTSALRKASGGGGAGTPRGGNHAMHGGGDATQADQKLRKRIGWLNSNGGFGQAIIYDKVVEASGGLPYAEVMKSLKDLEEKKADVKDPNAWVCSALRKAGGGGHGPHGGGGGHHAAPQWAPQAPAWGPPPPPMGYGGGWAAPTDPGFDSKIQKRVGWLNTQGGFANGLTATKVLEAAAGVDLQSVMKVLKDAEEKKDQLKDPNAYVTSALRKMGGGGRSHGGGGYGPPPHEPWGPPPGLQAWGGPPAHHAPAWGPPADPAWTPETETEDKKLRKRIGWLNSQGGFGGAIIYDKIMDAAGGLEFAEVFTHLKNLEEKKDTVKDPTSWVCAGLRKLAQGGGGQKRTYIPMGGHGHSPMGGHGPTDADSTSKLHKKVKWLNDPARFNGSLLFDKVIEAAAGLDAPTQMKIFKELEEKIGEVKDATAFVTSKMRKSGGGGRGGSYGMPGVRRTIQKH